MTPGALVKWYESYADYATVKDVGMGIVLSQVPQKHYQSAAYMVFRTKHSDVMYFGIEELEKYMNNKRVCVLQVAPEAPNPDHVSLFKNQKNCDFYFVTHK